MPTRRFARAVAAALALAVVAAGCGDDDGDPAAGAADAVDASDASGASDGSARSAVAAFSCPPAATAVGEAGDGPAGARLVVVTTVAPITSIVANVAGDLATVTGIIPEGEDSHTYEPRPSVAKVLAGADVVFVNGLKLEDPARDLAEANVPDGAEVVELGTLALSPDQYLYDSSFPRSAGKPNPHLWTNPPMAACYARIAASVMARADPANASGYAANAEAYVARLDELDRLMAEASAAMPAAGRKLLTYHDAYAYFAVRYDWTVVGAIQVSSFEDPTPREVADLIDQVRSEGVPAIFGSEVFPSPVLEQIGKEAGVSYVDTLRDDDLPGRPGDPDHSFLALLSSNFVTMLRSLGGDPSGIERFDPSDTAPDRAEYPQ